MLNIIVPFRSLMQDRYMYLALLGPLALVVNYLFTVVNSPAVRRGLIACTGIVILIYASLTYRQVELWSSPLTLWTSGATRLAYQASNIQNIHDYNAKVNYLREAIAANPSSGILHSNLATLHFGAGHINNALSIMETAAKLDPKNAVILLNLGRAYASLGRNREAEQLLSRAAALAPYSAIIRLNLARVYLSLGNTHAARYELDAFARLRPTSTRTLRKELVYLEQLEEAQHRQKLWSLRLARTWRP
jgi:cytochrome c-type biogenesis protein CcmH/NrfG